MNPSRLSVALLVVVNAIPLFGVLLFGWDLFQILFLYWFESAIIGCYDIVKLIKVKGATGILMALFFALHFGGFMSAHLVFLLTLFGPNPFFSGTVSSGMSGIFPSEATFFTLVRSSAIPILGLVVSHGVSFYGNFLKNGEYKYLDMRRIMEAPYRRIVVMQVTIIVGGWMVMLFQQPVLGLVLLIVMKTIVDAKAHLKTHASLGVKAENESFVT